MIMIQRAGARDCAWPPGLVCKILSLAAVFGALSLLTLPSPAEAKTPGSTYCYYGTCHRVKTIAETQGLIGTNELVQASFYESCKVDPYNPCGLTSSGETFRADRADNAASPIYPDGTTLLVWAPDTREAAVIRVNNAGPYWGKRTLDVSRATADALGFTSRGAAQLQVRVLNAPSEEEATYERNRSYKPVLGPVGQYSSIEEAQVSLAVMAALNSMPATVMTPVAGATLASAVDAESLRIEMPKIVVASTAKPEAASTVTERRIAAKSARITAKRSARSARRGGARRTTIASRRSHRGGARYAQSRRGGVYSRVARRYSTERSRVAVRRTYRRPAVTRYEKRYRRVADARIEFQAGGALHHGFGGLSGIPASASRDERAPRMRAPESGPVLVG